MFALDLNRCRHCVGRLTAFQLDELSAYRRSNAALQAFGLTHLVTGRALDGRTIGIAFVEGVARFGAFLYTASRTEWRRVHFELHGSPLDFALAPGDERHRGCRRPGVIASRCWSGTLTGDATS